MTNGYHPPIHRIYCSNFISQIVCFHGGAFMKQNEVKSIYKPSNRPDQEERKSNFNRLLITVINCELRNATALPVRKKPQEAQVTHGGALYR